MLLVRYQADYADEFDIHGIWLVEEKEYKAYLELAKKQFDKVSSSNPKEVYFGANEAMMFEDFESYEQGLTVKSITDEEAKTIKKLFQLDKTNMWGNFILIEEY